MKTAIDLLRLTLRRGAEREVSMTWLMRSPGKVNARFASTATVKILESDDDVSLIDVNGTTYAWPRGAPVDDLLAIVAEIVLPEHPHQYLWGQTQLNAGDVVIDIGSCEGSFAALAAGRGATVVAIEPSESMHRIIQRLFECRGLSPPHIVGCALGGTEGTATLNELPDHPAYATLQGVTQVSRPDQARSVRIMTLDQLVREQGLARVDYIKCDAEGYDLDIMLGGEATLRRDHPRLAVCTYHADDHFEKLHAYLTRLGYRVAGKGFLHAPGKFRVLMLHAWT